MIRVKSAALKLFWAVQLVSVCGCLATEAVCKWMLHLSFPYDWPVMPRYPTSLWDFTQYFDQFKRLHTTAFFKGNYEMMYPTPMVVWYRVLYCLQPHAKISMIVLIILLPALASVFVARALVRRGMERLPAALLLITMYFCAYPLWFELKQGNLEILVWVMTAMGVYATYRGKGYTGASLFGIVGSMKFYPIIFLGLLLSKRKFRECAVGLCVCGLSTLGSLWFVGPTIRAAWKGTGDGMALSQRDYLLMRRPREVGFDHSLFGLVKAAVFHFKQTGLLNHARVQPFSPRLLSLYLLTVALLGLALYVWKIRFLPFSNQVLCLTVASIVLPPMSFDYTLLHLYIPIAFLLMIAVDREVEGLPALLLLSALCVAPLSEFIMHFERVGGEIRAVLLLMLLVAGLRYPVSPLKREVRWTPRP